MLVWLVFALGGQFEIEFNADDNSIVRPIF